MSRTRRSCSREFTGTQKHVQRASAKPRDVGHSGRSNDRISHFRMFRERNVVRDATGHPQADPHVDVKFSGTVPSLPVLDRLA